MVWSPLQGTVRPEVGSRRPVGEADPQRPNPILRSYWILGSAGVIALVAQQSLGQMQGWRGGMLYAVAAALFGYAVTGTERRSPNSTARGVRSWQFNREANTICSKSNDVDVTRAGLALKAAIEQMREQVQNIE